MEDRLVGCRLSEEDVDEVSLRPRKFGEYIGQTTLLSENLAITSQTSKKKKRERFCMNLRSMFQKRKNK